MKKFFVVAVVVIVVTVIALLAVDAVAQSPNVTFLPIVMNKSTGPMSPAGFFPKPPSPPIHPVRPPLSPLPTPVIPTPTPKPEPTEVPTPVVDNKDCPGGTHYLKYRNHCSSDIPYAIYHYAEYGTFFQWNKPYLPYTGPVYIYTIISNTALGENGSCLKKHNYQGLSLINNSFPEAKIIQLDDGQYQLDITNEMFFNHHVGEYGYLYLIILPQPLDKGFYTQVGINMCPYVF